MSELISQAEAQESSVLDDASPGDLDKAIKAASARICKYCCREFVQQEFVDTYDGDGGVEMDLDQFPVVSVSSVVIIESDGTEVSIDGTEFRVRADTGTIRYKPDSTADYTYFPTGFQNVKITYTAGFEDVPADVKRACLLLAEALYATSENDVSVKSEKLGVYSVTYNSLWNSPLPAGVTDLINPYRDKQVA